MSVWVYVVEVCVIIWWVIIIYDVNVELCDSECELLWLTYVLLYMVRSGTISVIALFYMNHMCQ